MDCASIDMLRLHRFARFARFSSHRLSCSPRLPSLRRAILPLLQSWRSKERKEPARPPSAVAVVAVDRCSWRPGQRHRKLLNCTTLASRCTFRAFERVNSLSGALVRLGERGTARLPPLSLSLQDTFSLRQQRPRPPPPQECVLPPLWSLRFRRVPAFPRPSSRAFVLIGRLKGQGRAVSHHWRARAKRTLCGPLAAPNPVRNDHHTPPFQQTDSSRFVAHAGTASSP